MSASTPLEPEITYRLTRRIDVHTCDSSGCVRRADRYHYRRGSYSTFRCGEHALEII